MDFGQPKTFVSRKNFFVSKQNCVPKKKCLCSPKKHHLRGTLCHKKSLFVHPKKWHPCCCLYNLLLLVRLLSFGACFLLDKQKIMNTIDQSCTKPDAWVCVVHHPSPRRPAKSGISPSTPASVGCVCQPGVGERSAARDANHAGPLPGQES